MRRPSSRLRRWLIGVAVAAVALEAVYIVTAHLLLRGDALARLINRKPEKFRIEWVSARSFVPGVVVVEQLTLRGQSRKVQWYLEAGNVHGRISLLRLARKRVHLRSTSATGLDFRLRRRLDPPVGEDGDTKAIRGSEHFPEIPGFANPPDPRPEDLYPPPDPRKRPWVIDLGGIEVSGPLRVAVGRLRLDGEGSVSGGMVYRTRDWVRVRRASLRLPSARLLFDSEPAVDDLALDVASRWGPFPAKGAKLSQILGAASGSFAIAGDIRTGASVPIELVPGMPISATGRLDTRLLLDDGALQPGSSYALDSDGFRIGLLGLTAAGSAKAAATTRYADGRPVTEASFDLDSFSLLDAANASVGVRGSGLAVRAAWNGLSLADYEPATSVDVVLPPTEIADVGVLGALVPSQWSVAVASGTGTVSGRLAVDAARQASGKLELESKQLRVTARGTPMRADLRIHATLARGDLPRRRFEVPHAAVTVENAIEEARDPNAKGRHPWWCSLDFSPASVVLGRPLTAEGAVAVKMRDTRPVMALIDEFSNPPKWMALVPEVENVAGSAVVRADGAATTFEGVEIAGESLEMRGWLRLAGRKADARIYTKYKGIAAGIGLDRGKSDIHLIKAREWFDAQPTAPTGP